MDELPRSLAHFATSQDSYAGDSTEWILLTATQLSDYAAHSAFTSSSRSVSRALKLVDMIGWLRTPPFYCCCYC